MPSSRRVVVLGGGVSGLSFGHYLNIFAKNALSVKNAVHPQITVLEKDTSVGGWMKSHKDPQTGAVFEQGPRSLRAVGVEARSSLALVEELGLSDEVIHVKKTDQAGRNRLIYTGGALHSLPTKLLQMIRKFEPINRSPLSVALRDMRTAPSQKLKGKDESIHSFVSRRFGHEVAEKLADPFMRGIIAGDVRNTSIKAMIPELKTAEDMYGSVLRHIKKIKRSTAGVVRDSVLCRKADDQKWAMWNLKAGLKTIPEAIHKKLIDDGVDIRTNTACSRLEKTDSGFIVHTENESIEADFVIAAINSRALAKLLPGDYDKLSDKLADLPAVHVATATLEYGISSSRLPQAFGHLIPSNEGEKNLGVIYDSVVFPEHDRKDNSTIRVTAMIGGAWFEEVLGSNPSIADVEDVAMTSIAKQLGISEEPVNIHSNILWDAIPQYPVGHPDMIDGIYKDIDDLNLRLGLLGPSYDRPGANHCVHLAKVQAMNILAQWDQEDFQNMMKGQTVDDIRREVEGDSV